MKNHDEMLGEEESEDKDESCERPGEERGMAHCSYMSSS